MLVILAGLCLISGASALIYQVVWLRMLSLVLGVTVYAASTVLATFMAGLAIGSLSAGALADRVRRPLAWFGGAEILIAVTALSSPLALDVVTGTYGRLAEVSNSGVSLLVARVLCSALVLLPPTILMGSTLPFVLKAAFLHGGAIGERTGLLYGINTTGAIAGAVAAGFVLIGTYGMRQTTWLAAALNVVVGLGALALSSVWRKAAAPAVAPVGHNSRREGADSVTDENGSEGRPSEADGGVETGVTPLPAPHWVVAVAFALSGFTSLALEVVWFRTLVLYFPATTYAFTAMLAAVLAGIAIGSLVAAPLLRRAPTLLVFGGLHAGIGLAVLLGFRWLGATYAPSDRFASIAGGALVTIFPPAVLMGAAFPVGVRLWLRSAAAAGRGVGLLYAVNMAGAIAGSLAGGFFPLRRFGSVVSLRSLAAVSGATGTLVLLVAARRAPRVALAAAVLAAGAFTLAAQDLPDPFVTGLLARYRDGRIFFRDEGIQTTVSVHVRELGGRRLYLEGLHQASDGADVVRLHRQIGHLPLLLHPSPRRALVIGLGGGATAGAASLHPLAIDVVEISPGVVRASTWFTHINENVTARPNVHVRIDDARNFLLLAGKTYDVITADIIQPTHAGAGLLYSQEYFRLARRALNDGGLMVQWVGHRSRTHYELIARTFQSVFPETTVWVDGSLLIGSTRPLEVDAAALAPRLAGDGALRASLADSGFATPQALLSQFTAGPDDLRRFIGEGPILTDDRPMLEFYLSLPESAQPLEIERLRRQ